MYNTFCEYSLKIKIFIMALDRHIPLSISITNGKTAKKIYTYRIIVCSCSCSTLILVLFTITIRCVTYDFTYDTTAKELYCMNASKRHHDILVHSLRFFITSWHRHRRYLSWAETIRILNEINLPARSHS
jgi:hypothetical protein